VAEDPFGDVPDLVKLRPPDELAPGERLVQCRHCPAWFVALSAETAGSWLSHHYRHQHNQPRETIVIPER
jgi:hypothetical protein